MSYTQDKNGIVIKGFEKGIADNPFNGLANMRNVNTVSIPGEASVSFATTSRTPATGAGDISSVATASNQITLTASSGSLPEDGQAIIFAGGSLPTGITAAQVYWVNVISAGVYELYADFGLASIVDITASGTGTWSTPEMGYPKYFVNEQSIGVNFLLDDNGRVWSDYSIVTTNWRYIGNLPNNYSEGNGLVLYGPSGVSTEYLFVMSRDSIDYVKLVDITSTNPWKYQWDPSAGTIGVWSATPTDIMNSSASGASHEAILAPDNRVYYCDGNYISRFYQTDPAVAFVPTTLSTYTFDETPLLPSNDASISLAYLGTNLLIGGSKNIIYPWDRFSNQFSYPILLNEFHIKKLVTVNSQTFVFCGNRGRIYVTNGSSVNLYKKIPDHISGTIEPYFQWGGASWNKNQLYFGFSVTSNSGSSNTNYAGLWAIDTDTNALREVNSMATYPNSYITAVFPNLGTIYQLTDPAGSGLFIGWSDGTHTGLDQSSGDPYTDGTTIIDSDYIPVGTVIRPETQSDIEFKLAVPIVSGESIKLQYRQKLSDSFTDISSTELFNYTTYQSGSWNGYAGVYQKVPFQNSQWLQIRAVLTSTATTPSYVRLTEIRIRQ